MELHKTKPLENYFAWLSWIGAMTPKSKPVQSIERIGDTSSSIGSNPFIKTSGISAEQQKLIDTLKTRGYGWAEFAKSVEQSGKCSDKQELTLRNMEAKSRSSR